MAEWGNRHVPSPEYDNVAWATDPYRRCCTANAWVGQTLASHVMNLNDFWNHPSYFDYMDRYMATELTGSWTRSWSGWQGEMWDDYRDAY